MPLIRYRTRDISRFVDTPCGCGAASLKKIGAVKKRMDAVVKLVCAWAAGAARDAAAARTNDAISTKDLFLMNVVIECSLPRSSLENK